MQRHKSGVRSVVLQHQFKLVAFPNEVFKAQPEEATGFVLQCLAVILQEGRGSNIQPMSFGGGANSADFTAR